jgi:hypothetical protein
MVMERSIPIMTVKLLGSGQAKIQGGLTNRFAYKNFDFSFVMYARFGGLLVSQVHQPFAAYTNLTDGVRMPLKPITGHRLTHR